MYAKACIELQSVFICMHVAIVISHTYCVEHLALCVPFVGTHTSLSLVLPIACENSPPSSLPARVAFREMVLLAKRHSGWERRRTAVFAGYVTHEAKETGKMNTFLASSTPRRKYLKT